MYDFPSIKSYQKIGELFEALITSKVPNKFTYRYLAQLGFASSNDRDIIPSLKKLGFLDNKSKPTNSYLSLRDPSNFKKTLSEAINMAYKSLFEYDEHVTDVSESVLTGYFSKLTGTSQSESLDYAKTFLELIRESGYKKEIEPERIDKIRSNKLKEPATPNINLTINLPTTTDEKVYQALFKHLKDLLNHQ